MGFELFSLHMNAYGANQMKLFNKPVGFVSVVCFAFLIVSLIVCFFFFLP